MWTGQESLLSKLTQALADKMGADRFSLWFPQLRLALEDHQLVICVPSKFQQDCVRRNLGTELLAVARTVIGPQTQLAYRIAALPSIATDPTSPPLPLPEPAIRVAPQTLPLSAAVRTGQLPAGQGVPAASNGHSNGAAQVRRRRFAEFESLVLGTSNRLAIGSARLAVDQPGQVSPLVFHGPTGTGKTHLLEAIWSATKRVDPKRQVLYLTAEQFTSEFVGALQGGLPSFRRKYRALQMLLLDDVQFFRGKKATLVELLHTLNTLITDGKQIVLTADRAPHELTELGNEVTARLAGGLVCALEPADYAMRLAIVEQLALRVGLALPREVCARIASCFAAHTRELAGAVNLLQAVHRATGQPITLGIAEETLAEQFRASARVVRLPDIERAICDVFGMAADSLHSNGRTAQIVQPRMLAMFLARKHTRAPFSEIGSYFGRKSHSTVISAQKQVEAWMTQDLAMSLPRGRCGVSEAIRLVERKLDAG